MSAFRFKAARATLSAEEVRALRTISPLGIAEILRRAKAGESLLDVPIFAGGCWADSKATLVAILARVEAGDLPLRIYHVYPGLEGPEVERHLGLEGARACLGHLREIALEQDMLSQLETGEISGYDEYRPLPEDEA